MKNSRRQKGIDGPLLRGAAAEPARDAVFAIAADLSLWMAEKRLRQEAQVRSPLAGGSAGISLFFAYLHLAFPACGWDDLCLQAITDALAVAGDKALSPSLFSGFAGVGWVLRHLEGRAFEVEEDPGAEVEDALLELLAQYQGRWPHELIAGLAGYGMYFLERLPREPARRGAGQVIERLAGLAVEEDGGIAWFTPAEAVAPVQREIAAAGCYNLGVAHGIPGVLGFLAAALRSDVESAAGVEARRLLTGAVPWLLSQRLPERLGGGFPALAGPGIDPVPTRLAWCYGDLGIAAVLLAAARAVGRKDWEREALACARAAAARRGEETLVADACLCHGAAGAGHIFHRLFRATGDETLREAALFWLGRTLEMRQPGQGPGGFRSAGADAAGQRIWTAEPGFLAGAAGVGLALLAAISPVEPEWDRVLLLG